MWNIAATEDGRPPDMRVVVGISYDVPLKVEPLRKRYATNPRRISKGCASFSPSNRQHSVAYAPDLIRFRDLAASILHPSC